MNLKKRKSSNIDTFFFKAGDNLYLDPDKQGALVALKAQSIDTFRKQVEILMIDICYDHQHLAKHLDLPLATFSRRLNEDDFNFDDKQKIRALGKIKGFVIRF